jgi:hypothetical protein
MSREVTDHGGDCGPKVPDANSENNPRIDPNFITGPVIDWT